jgi:hypothetical protein
MIRAVSVFARGGATGSNYSQLAGNFELEREPMNTYTRMAALWLFLIERAAIAANHTRPDRCVVWCRRSHD